MKELLLTLVLTSFLNQIYCQTATTLITVLDTMVFYPTMPAISGNSVVFVDYRNFIYSLYQVDINTKHEQVVLHNIGYTEPQIRLSDDQVVWIGYPTLTQADLYVRNLSSNETINLTEDAAFQNYPDIHKDKIVWQDYRNASTTNNYNTDIYMYDFLTGQTQQITTDISYQTSPSIWKNYIVWEDHRNAHTDSTNADIYIYNLLTNKETQITSDISAQINPDIWEDKIVWEDYRNNGVGDIYMYDLSTNTERAISTYSAYKSHPVIYRDWIVWQDYRNGAYADIYGFNLATNEEYPVIVQPHHQDFATLDSLNLIWQDFRFNRQDLYHAVLKNNSTTNAVDDNGRIFDFALQQNYPNPFNPSTVIKYQIRENGFVTLKIYDILGKEVYTLVNEEKNTGRYEASFNASLLTSGVYIYTLSVSSAEDRSVISKKMVLVK